MPRRPVLAKFRLGNLASPVSSANSGDIDTDQEDAQNRLSPLQLIAANPRGSANAAAVNRLKKAELQEELNLRGLPEEGTRDVLRQRLNQAIKSEQSVPAGDQALHPIAAGVEVLRANIHPACIKGVFISHLHGDHCFGLPGLIELVSEAHEAAKSPNDMRILQIFGPPGIQQLVKGALAVSMPRLHTKLVVTDYTLDPSHAKAETAVDPTGLIAFARLAPDAQSRPDLQQPPRGRSRSHNRQQQSLQVHNVPVIPGLVWTIHIEEGIVVTAAQLQHRLPCWGYVFQEKASQTQPGRKVVLLGDTCDSEAIVGPGMGADLVSHEATFSAGMEKKAHVAQHSTAPMAGAFARKIRAKALVLTHFSNRYSNRGEMQGEQLRSESEGDRQDVLRWLTNQAKEAYGSDSVWAADDFYTFQVYTACQAQFPIDQQILQKP
ncbi:hypothetical protein WJX82_000641 [Trebouxia sp. C0006]